VLGLGYFDNGDVPPLKGAVPDAFAVVRFLMQECGYGTRSGGQSFLCSKMLSRVTPAAG
jgi:hypothetical protein